MRGRPLAPEAVVLGRPALEPPTGALALEVVDLLAEILYVEVTEPLRVSTVTGGSGLHPRENASKPQS
jgi:hypothetical protein